MDGKNVIISIKTFFSFGVFWLEYSLLESFGWNIDTFLSFSLITLHPRAFQHHKLTTFIFDGVGRGAKYFGEFVKAG